VEPEVACQTGAAATGRPRYPIFRRRRSGYADARGRSAGEHAVFGGALPRMKRIDNVHAGAACRAAGYAYGVSACGKHFDAACR